MATLIEEIAEYLEDEGIGTVGTSIFIGKLPDDADVQNDIVAIFDTGGFPPDAHVPLKERTVQIIVRDTLYVDANTTATSVRDLLHNRFWQDIVSGGTIFQLRSSALQEPTNIGQDDKNRYEISCNYLFLTR